MRSGERFGAGERILRSRDFRQIQRTGLRRVGRFVVAIGCRASQPWTRIGLTVSRKVGNATVRNRVKRRLREIFRRNKASLPQHLDIVLIARSAAAQAPFEALSEEVIRLCQELTSARRPTRAPQRRPRRGGEGGASGR